jgi:uncharacterized protein YkwD
MRKPLVVVCGVAAAVLIAGGVAATTAGADEGPGFPAVPGLDFQGMPGIPQFADGDADSDGGQDDPALTLPGFAGQGQDQDGQDDQDDQDGQDGQGQAGQGQAGQGQAGQGQAAQQAGQAGQGQDGQNQNTQDQNAGAQAQQRPGGQGAGAQPQAAQPQAGQPQGAQPQGAQHQPQHQPIQQRPAQQRPAGILAAAKRDVTPGSFSMNPAAPVQQQVLALVNQNRRNGGCGNLSLDRRLIAAAYDHAADMARRGYFAHESPNGDGSSDRMSEAGYRWSRYGENIARGQDSAYEVVDGWMHSPVHRENIMDCRLHQMGIGLAFAPDKMPYWVQDFATPR